MAVPITAIPSAAMESEASTTSTPPSAMRRTSSQDLTPPSVPMQSSGSNKVPAAVNYFESRSRASSPGSMSRGSTSGRGSSRRVSEASQGGTPTDEVDKRIGGSGGSSGKRTPGSSSRGGSPTPVKGSGGRRPAISRETTPTRPAPRKSLSGSNSKIPDVPIISHPTRLMPRATPPPPAGSNPSVPFPRSVSQGQSGPSRLPRPVQRVSAATAPTSAGPPSGSVRPAPKSASSPGSASRIPIPSPRRRPREASDSVKAPSRSLMDTIPSAPSMVPEIPVTSTTPPDSTTPIPGSRRTSYHLQTTPSAERTSPTPTSHSRRPSSGSLGSPSRRPSGPRQPLHNPRSSITSLSSLMSDEGRRKESDGRRTSQSGRSSVLSVSELGEMETSSSHLPSTTDPATPVRPIRINIPRRTSSQSSTRSPRTARPPISPRFGSREDVQTFSSISRRGAVAEDTTIAAPVPERPPIDSKRRASKAIQLGGVASMVTSPEMVDLSEMGNADFMPGPSTMQRLSRVGRRTSQMSIGSLPTSEGVAGSSYIPEAFDSGVTPNNSSVKPGSNKQGLVVDTSYPTHTNPDSPRRLSSAQASPPIPVKNPMRQLSRPGSVASVRRVVSDPFRSDSPGPRTPSTFLDSPAEEPEDGTYAELGKMPASGGGDERHTSDITREAEKKVLGEWGWGTKRRGRIMEAGEMEALILAADKEVQKRISMESISSRGQAQPGAPSTPVSAIPTTTMTFSTPILNNTTAEESGLAPRTPDLPRHTTPSKSPSMPLLGLGSAPPKANRLLGLSPTAHTQQRSGTDPMAAQNRLLPPPMLRSPTSPNIPMSAGIERPAMPRPPSTNLSKRSHLIREIAMTERAYANDLALLRDAFIGRTAQRRPSMHSLADSSINGASPIADSSRASMVASQSIDPNRRTSEHSTHSTMPTVPPPTSPHPITPSATSETIGGMSSFFTSSSSLSPLPVFSPRTSTIGMNMTPPVGKPLSPADIRAIFLNIDQLASASEDLAADFEQAIGEEEAGPGVSAREGEGGTDKIGEVFMAHLPRLRPLYTFYCARQSTASVRLVEIQGDSTHITYLKDRWEQIKAHTHAWNLDSMLIKPVQRITKYPLLFDDLLACTTPVHPDYFSIRTAAEQCRTMAQEIDDAKRRKDLVAGVINKKKSGTIGNQSSKESKTPKKVGGGLKLFRNKDKEKGSTISLANTLSSQSTTSLANGSSAASTTTLVPSPSDLLGREIPQASFSDYRLLVEKLEDAERTVRRVGREVVLYTAAAKEVFVSQMALTAAWERVVKLDTSDPGDKRLRAFRKVGEGLIEGCWTEFNNEVRTQIMPALTKLLDCSLNPRKVIIKRDAKAADYARVTQSKDRSRPVDRTILDSAREFTALHTQLLEELPAFLDGYTRILDLTILAFSKAQARYNLAIRDKIEAYAKSWIPTILPDPSSISQSPSIQSDNEAIDLSDDPVPTPAGFTRAQSILQAWQSAWTPYSEAMDHFRITRPPTTRTMADRMADYSDRTGTKGHVRSSSIRSGGASPTGSMSGIRPDPSTYNLSRRSSGNTKVPSPASSVRRLDLGTSPSRPSTLLSPNGGGDRNSAISVGRHSFGLPRISPSGEEPFVDLAQGFGGSRSRASSMLLSPQLGGLGLGRMTSPTTQVGVVPPTPPTIDPGNRSTSYSDSSVVRRQGVLEDDAGEGWRNEQVLYQCSVVADFDPTVFGSKRYRKLRFLPVTAGDLIDVFYEVGRIDELPVFPYPEIGVENDGLLVGRKEDGDIGLVICSFLEPIT